MAITVSSQPATGWPHGISEPLKFFINAGGANLVSFGGLPYFTVTFNASGGIDGQVIEAAGLTFTTDSGQPYTASTWSYAGTVEQVAENFANMIRSNFAFQDFRVYKTETAPGEWTVYVQSSTFGLVDNFTFDYSALVPPLLAHDEFEGEDTVLKNFQIWYRVYNVNQAVGPLQFARVPFSTNSGSEPAEIDIREEARSVVFHLPPRFNAASFVQYNGNYSAKFNLRFGGVEYDDNCNPTYLEGGDTDEIEVTAAIFQQENYLRFLGYTPLGGLSQIKWLTTRPNQLIACPGSFEWLPIWIAEGGDGWSLPFKAVWKFYDADDVQLSQHELDIPNLGFNEIAVGHGNLGTVMASGSAYYTIEIQGTQGGGYQQYSQLARRDIAGCDCNVAEVYYLEDTGGWGTVIFQRLEGRTIEQIAQESETVLDETFSGLNQDPEEWYIDGGRSSVPVFADRVFTLTTERISEPKRPIYEQIVRSPEFYIRTAITNYNTVPIDGYGMRRIIPDRQNVVTWQDGQAVRISIPFRFNTSLNLHR